MGRTTDVQSFSGFIFELYDRANTQDSLALLKWSAQTLARAVHTDRAWCGWMDITHKYVEICGAVSHNLAPDYYQYWRTLGDEDLIARDFAGSRRKIANYDRLGERQTDGMIAIADRYHYRFLTVFAAYDRNSSLSLFLSLYRGGHGARQMHEEETEYVSAAVDHVLRASALADTSMSETPRLIVNERGRILASSRSAKRILRDRWPQWKSKGLPQPHDQDLVSGNVEYFSRDGFRVEKRQIRNMAGPPLFSVTLRPDDRRGALTNREQQIAEKIVLGLTHKEIARDLDISPATVRNYTQSALTKLGAPNKAALAAIIPRP